MAGDNSQLTGPKVEIYRRLTTASTNAAIVRNAPGKLRGALVINSGSALEFLKIYNKATIPDENDTPIMTIAIPHASGAGSGATFTFPENTVFSAGIGIRVVAGRADNDTTNAAGASTVHLFYE